MGGEWRFGLGLGLGLSPPGPLVQQGLVKQNANAMAEMRTFTAKQTSLDKLERLLLNKQEDEEGQGRVDRHLSRVLEFLKKEETTSNGRSENRSDGQDARGGQDASGRQDAGDGRSRGRRDDASNREQGRGDDPGRQEAADFKEALAGAGTSDH